MRFGRRKKPDLPRSVHLPCYPWEADGIAPNPQEMRALVGMSERDIRWYWELRQRYRASHAEALRRSTGSRQDDSPAKASIEATVVESAPSRSDESATHSARSTARKRSHIRKRIRQKVWIRDGGRCVDCGSTRNLEYDHIIPHSKGGADTVPNLQLLCIRCNRKKGAKIQ
jgi:5-methylcytosine-specific restriction endonuclease McrA